MEDRNVQFPQRYQMKKVEGTEDIFDLIPAPGEISSEGTLINKATLWKDATAALFGLGVDSVPDDGFAWIGKYAQHWWKRREIEFQEVQTTNTNDSYVVVLHEMTLYYSTSIVINQTTGKVSLDSPSALELSHTQGETLANLSPVYITGAYGGVNDIIFLPEGSTYNASYKNSDTLWHGPNTLNLSVVSSEYSGLTAKFISSEKVVTGNWEYVQSSDRSAYPDSGEQDGYEYEYLGIPFDNAVGAPKVEVGSYTGTGTYGASKPNKLTFGFVPKIWGVIFYRIGTGNANPVLGTMQWGVPETSQPFTFFTNGSNQQCNGITYDGTTVSWYSNNGYSEQLNISGNVYYYFAIG